MGRRADGQLSDKDIVDYLNKRAYVECTDMGQEDPNRFALDMYPGDFRHAISLHITRLRTAELLRKAPTPTPLTMNQVEDRLKGRD